MSKLDDILTEASDAIAKGVATGQWSPVYTKQQIKALMLELIGENDEQKYNVGNFTYGDTQYDSASVTHGINEDREALRYLVERL